MAAVQIARHVCRAGLVITTAGSDERAARGKELGAHESINYTSTDFLAEVMRLTGGRGVDVVLELVGGETFSRSQQALAKGGRMVAAGRSSGEPSVVDEELARDRQQQVWATWGAMGGVSDQVRAEALAEILELVRDSKLKVVIDRVFPLSEAPAAHRYLAGRNQFGKVLLRP
jgi:NADPH2:quinone reductase